MCAVLIRAVQLRATKPSSSHDDVHRTHARTAAVRTGDVRYHRHIRPSLLEGRRDATRRKVCHAMKKISTVWGFNGLMKEKIHERIL